MAQTYHEKLRYNCILIYSKKDDEIDVAIPDYLREAFKLPRRSDTQPYIIKKDSPLKDSSVSLSTSYSFKSNTTPQRSYHQSIITVNKKPISPIPIQKSPSSSSSFIPPPPPPPPPPEDEFSKTDSTISSHGQLSDSDLSSVLHNLSISKTSEISPLHQPPPPPPLSPPPPEIDNKKTKQNKSEIDIEEKLIKRSNRNNNEINNYDNTPLSSPYITETVTPQNTPRYDLIKQNKKFGKNKELTVTPLVDKTVQLEKEPLSTQSQQQNTLQKQIIKNKLKQQEQQQQQQSNNNNNNNNSTESTPNTSRNKSPKKKVKHQITKQDILWAISKMGKEQLVQSIYEQICRNSLE